MHSAAYWCWNGREGREAKDRAWCLLEEKREKRTAMHTQSAVAAEGGGAWPRGPRTAQRQRGNALPCTLHGAAAVLHEAPSLTRPPPDTLAPRPDPGLRRSPLASRFAGRPRDSRLDRGSKWRPHSGSLPRARSSGSGLQRPHRRLACAGKSERSPNLAGFRNLLPVAVVPSLLDFFQRPRRDGRPEILSLWPGH